MTAHMLPRALRARRWTSTRGRHATRSGGLNLTPSVFGGVSVGPPRHARTPDVVRYHPLTGRTLVLSRVAIGAALAASLLLFGELFTPEPAAPAVVVADVTTGS
jgi:hypothetical protein